MKSVELQHHRVYKMPQMLFDVSLSYFWEAFYGKVYS